MLTNYVKRILSFALALIMVLGMLPLQALATEEDSHAGHDHEVVENQPVPQGGSELLNQVRGEIAAYIEEMGISSDMSDVELVNHYITFDGKKAQAAWEDYEAIYELAQGLSQEEADILLEEENTQLAMNFYKQLQVLYGIATIANSDPITLAENIAIRGYAANNLEFTNNEDGSYTISGTGSSGCSDSAGDTKAQIQNTSGKPVIITFDWVKGDGIGEFKVNNTATTEASGSATITLATKNGFQDVIYAKTSGKGTGARATFTVSNIVIKGAVTFGATENGSYTVNGEAPADKTDVYGTTYELVATPAEGYVLKGWYENGSEISRDATFTYTNKGNATVKPEFISDSMTVEFAAPQGNGTYTVNGEAAPVTKVEGTGAVYSLAATPNSEKNAFVGWYMGDQQISTEPTVTLTTGVDILESCTIYAQFRDLTAYNITVDNDASRGSVSTAGVWDGVCYEDTQVTLTANPASGYAFLAWTDADGKVVSTDSTYKFVPTADVALKAVFRNPSAEAWFKVDGKLFNDLNAAVAAGTKVVLAADGTLPAGDYTIPSGVTLLLPRDTKDTVDKAEPTLIDKQKNGYVQPYAFRTLQMAEGANITIDGAVSVAGALFAGGTGDVMGGVYGPVGFIKMATGSKITVNNGAYLYTWGYIVGSGEVEVLSGATVYEAFQTMDWRGGTAATNIVGNSQKIFPVNQYYVQNIEVPTKMNAGAVEVGYTGTTLTASSYSTTSGAPVPFVGNGGLFSINSGYLLKDYDEVNDRQVYEIHGDVSMDKIVIEMKVSVIKEVTVDSSEYVLPITCNLTVDVVSGTIGITQDLAFLPGSEIIVREGAYCNLANGKSVYVYDADNWGGYAGSGNATFIPLKYAPGRIGTRTALSDAKIQIDGIVNADAGYLYTTEGGAIITSTGTGKVNMKLGEETKTYQYTQSGTDCTAVAIPVVVAKLQNVGDTTTNPAAEINPAAGTTYTYTNGVWVPKCNSTVVDGKTVSTCVPVESEETGSASCKSTTCQYCGGTIAGNHPEDKIETIPAKAATCTETGLTAGKKCTACGEIIEAQEEIDALGHDGDLVAGKSATCYETGLTEGKKCAVCGEIIEAQKVIQMTEHTWNYGEYEQDSDQPTCTEEGTMLFSCVVCEAAGKTATKTEKVPATGHTKVTEYKQVDPKCNETGLKAYYYCEACDGYYTTSKSEDHKVLEGKIEDINAWKANSSENGGLLAVLPHTPGNAATCTEDQTCTECGTVLEEKLGHNVDEVKSVEGKAAECGIAGYEACYQCPRCEVYFADEACKNDIGDADALSEWQTSGSGRIAPLNHNTEGVEAVKENEKAATCEVDGGYDMVTRCARCNEVVTSAHTPLPKSNHKAGTAVRENEKAATCYEEGSYELATYCINSHCDVEGGKELSRVTKTSEKLAHTEATREENKVDSTCAKEGSYELVTYCSVEACGEVISRESKTIAKKEHTVVPDNRVEPTCTLPGKEAGSHCGKCGEVLVKQTEIAATGHKFGKVTYTWAKDYSTCTASRVCANGNCPLENKTESETVTAKAVTTDAICGQSGSTVYTAEFANEAFETQTHTETIAALAHDWTDVTYTWAADKATCTAERTCSRANCPVKEQKETVSATRVTTAATCTTDGKIVYTADFNAQEFETKTETVVLTAGGHNWGAVKYTWNVEALEATATKTCQNNHCAANEKTVTATVDIELTDSKAADCDNDGYKTYTAAFGDELGGTKTHTVTEDAKGHTPGETFREYSVNTTCTVNGVYQEVRKCVDCGSEYSRTGDQYEDKKNHDWGDASYSWDAEFNCTATRVCSKQTEAACTETETVKGIGKVTVSATCTAAGEMTYTATFANSAFAEQTKTDVIEKLDHQLSHQEKVEATCLTSGHEEYWYCSGCKTYYKNAEATEAYGTDAPVIEAIGHTWNEPTYQWTDVTKCVATRVCSNGTCTETEEATITSETTDAKCEVAGKTVYTAAFVNDAFKTQTKETVIPALKHVWSEVTYTWGENNATCTAERTCSTSGCVETETVNAVKETTAAKCEEDGKHVYTATFEHSVFEQQVEEETIGATGHRYDDGKETTPAGCEVAGVKTFTCQNDPSHTYTEAIEPLEHAWELKVTSIAPSCENETDGEGWFYCEKCRNMQLQVIEWEHTWVAADRQDPTCTEDGHESGRTCSECGAVEEDTTVLPALGHTFADADATNDGKWVVETAETCVANGEKRLYCTRCDDKTAYLSEVIDEIDGHSYDEIYTDPTCTEDGYTTKTCQRVGCTEETADHQIIVVDENTALGHELKFVSGQPATCDLDGWKDYYMCADADPESGDRTCYCGAYFEDAAMTKPIADLPAWRTAGAGKIDALGHTYEDADPNNDGQWNETKADTCTEIGEERRDCGRCDAYETREVNNIAGHSLTHTKEAEPTCDHAGNYEYWYCDTCKVYFADAEAQNVTNWEALNRQQLVHDFTQWSETKPDTCLDAGEERRECQREGCDHYETRVVDEIKGHDYKSVVTEPGCETQGYTTDTCSRCGDVQIHSYTPRKEHVRTDVEGKTPDCENDGYKACYQCSNCQLYFSDAAMSKQIEDLQVWRTTEGQGKIAKLNHNEVIDAAVPATCTELGKTEGKHCDRCGEILVAQEEIPMLAHVPNKFTGRPAACETDGWADYYQCTSCERFFSDALCTNRIMDLNEWQTTEGQGKIAKLGHTAKNAVIENEVKATCTTNGSYDEVVYCKTCGEELSRENKIEESKGHTEVTDEAVEVTCTTNGLTEGKHCSVCGETIVEQKVIEAQGHKEVTDEAVAPDCENTGLTEGKHCEVCGTVLQAQTVLPAKGHTVVTDKAIAATCTEPGKTEGKHCSVCNEVLVPQEPVDALKHIEVTDEAVPATCTESGKTEGSHCDRCGETLVAQKPIEKLGHTEETVSGKPATCTEAGLKDGKKCSVCGEWTLIQEAIPALSHNPVTDKAVAPTCTEPGLTEGSHCDRCGETLVAQKPVDKLGHNEVTDKAVAPTCTEPGLTEGKHCDRCGETLVAQKPVDKLGHNEVIDKAVPTTCTEDGKTEGSHCDRCGETLVAQEPVKAPGHTEVIDKAVAATCTEDGKTEGKHCSVCNEVLKNQIKIPAKGHTEEILPKKNPTCTETGLEAGKICSVCKETLVAQVEIPAKGHIATKIAGQAAACELAGWKDYYRCETCKVFFEDEACTKVIEDVSAWRTGDGKIEGLKHIWDEGRVTTLPTCDVDGVRTLTCKTCNVTKNEAEPMLGHKAVQHEGQHPTYYSIGWEAYETCEVCDYTSFKAIDALGEPSVNTYEDFMSSLKLLEGYANDYAKANPGKDPMWLLIKYVRTGVDRYNSGSWQIMAGYEDENFAEYVKTREEEYNKSVPTVEEMINVTGIKNIGGFDLPNGQEVDFGHMFGTMDITYHNKTSINHADVSGWAGDLVDLLSTADRHDVTGTVDEMIKEIGDTYLNHSIEGESDQFSRTDMYGDLDGYYFMNEIIGKDYENGMLYGLMEDYFVASLTDEQRADYFLKNRLGGVTGRTEIREAVFAEYTGNSVIATLEGTREFKQSDISDMRKACCYAFADYMCYLAGDYVELGDNPYFTVTSTELSTLAPGIVQQISKAITADGKNVVYYTATADVSSPYVNVYANYKDNDPSKGWGMQRVMDQANAAQAKYGDPNSDQYIENFNVIAAINGAGYNMTTGEPSGVLMMGGVEYQKPNGDGFVGILKDGSAYIGTDAEYYAMKEQGLLSEAISGFGTVLVRDGKIAVNAGGSYFNDRASRTAFGITKTGKVVFMVMDGRQEPVSCGGSAVEIAQVMLEAGCVYAINLDGGGSTTYVARQPGDDALSLVSSPSDGFQRSVSTSWYVASTAPSSTAFDHAVLDSEVRHMTIGASVQVTAAGVSATGNPAELPEGATWAVSNATVASINADGLVTGLANGQVDVNLMVGDQVVGSRTLHVVVPDAVYFTKENMNAVYGEPLKLPVAALFEGKPVAILESDAYFTLSNDAAGTTSGFTFTGIEESGIKTVKIFAHATNNPNATSGSMGINMFRADEASFDFENVDGGDRLLAWNRVVSNSTTVDGSVYTVVDMDKPMVTEYTFGMDMTQIPMPEILEDLVYMLPGADVDGNNSAWSFLLQLAERVSVLTNVTATIQVDPNFDVDYSGLTVNCEYFTLNKIELNEETNELVLSLSWKDQTKAIDPDTANPMVIMAGIKLTPKADAAWDAKDRLPVINAGNISYDIYLRANALYSFAQKPENQETFKIYPFYNEDVIIGGAPESGGHFSDVYKTFADEYTLNKGLKNGWVYEDGGYAYYEDGEKYTGIQKVGLYYYDFGSTGVNMGQTKFTGMFQMDGVNHYAKEGLLSGGWHIDKAENKYYFDETGKAVDGEFVIDEVKMVFENGLLVGGHSGFLTKSNGNTYYFQNGSMYYGWLQLGDDWYHFNVENGIMTVGNGTADSKLFPDQEAKAKGAYYVFAEDGRALYGFPNGYGYYYWAGQPMRSVWVRNGYDLDGWYHTNDNGHFVTTSDASQLFELTIGEKTYTAVKIAYDGVVYTFDNSNGKLLLGSMVYENGQWFYYWAGAPVNNGWFTFNGDTYYAFSDGHLATGSVTINGEDYMFTPQGVLITEGIMINASVSEDNKTMNVKVLNADEKMTAARMAMWAVNAGQAPTMQWHDLVKQDDGTWIAKVSLCTFGLEENDSFEMHVYGTVDEQEALIVNTTVADVAPAEHTYTDAKDPTCDICGFEREIIEEPEQPEDPEKPEEPEKIATTPMYRLYNPNTGEHFYTGSTEERDMLVEAGWTYEGIAWNAPIYTGAPVYRVFNPNSGDHHYTMSQEEIDMLVELGWQYEGVAWNSAPVDHPEAVAQFRLYNPNADIGSHHYTSSVEERDFLVSLGWIFEGIGWFGMLK